ncbi:hypothetical protein HS121_17970 [bacterium]|nr:hypothetical protein [bacterium]
MPKEIGDGADANRIHWIFLIPLADAVDHQWIRWLEIRFAAHQNRLVC